MGTSTFKFCTDCGMPIEVERLELLPDCHTCIACATKAVKKNQTTEFRMIADDIPDHCLKQE